MSRLRWFVLVFSQSWRFIARDIPFCTRWNFVFSNDSQFTFFKVPKRFLFYRSTVHRKIVEMERFALLTVILISNVPRGRALGTYSSLGRGGEGRKIFFSPPPKPSPAPLVDSTLIPRQDSEDLKPRWPPVTTGCPHSLFVWPIAL